MIKFLWKYLLGSPFTEKRKKKIFNELFDEQISILSKRYGEKFVKIHYLPHRERVIKYAMEMPLCERYIPFIPAVRRVLLDDWDDCVKIYHNRQKPFKYEPTFIFNCECGYNLKEEKEKEKTDIKNILVINKEIISRSSAKWIAYWSLWWPLYFYSE